VLNVRGDCLCSWFFLGDGWLQRPPGQFILNLLYRKQARCKEISALRFFAKKEPQLRPL